MSVSFGQSAHLFMVATLSLPGCYGEGVGPVDAAADADDGVGDDDGGAQADDGPVADIDPWADFDPGPRCAPFAGLQGLELQVALLDRVRDHTYLGYDEARTFMFSTLDNVEGRIQCVYTGSWVDSAGVPDPAVMNLEHTWCQSWGAGTVPPKSDLNHLFPALSRANNLRSDNPLGEVLQATWSEGGSSLGLDAAGRLVFEPRDSHKGDAARALFYFALRYEKRMDNAMEEALRLWNQTDHPNSKERQRVDDIENVQHTRNPFVDCPHLVDRIADF